MRERDVEAHLVKRVKALGGEVRKVRWVGRSKAPDRFVMLPRCPVWWPRNPWVEVKHPDTGHLFPMDAHERAQAREHERMRACGEFVMVVWTKQQVDNLLEGIR